MASIAAAIRGSGDHASIGIGGLHRGGAQRSGHAVPGWGDRLQVLAALPAGDRGGAGAGHRGHRSTLRTEDLVRGDLVLSATEGTSGDVLHGVEYRHEGARTQTLVMCTKCRQVRFVETVHSFSPDPKVVAFWKVR